jgi:hypothetical protein
LPLLPLMPHVTVAISHAIDKPDVTCHMPLMLRQARTCWRQLHA